MEKRTAPKGRAVLFLRNYGEILKFKIRARFRTTNINKDENI